MSGAVQDEAEASVARAAALIAGAADAPGWLPTMLRAGVDYVRTLRAGEAAMPDRAALRARCAALVEALELVERETDAWPIWMMLEDARAPDVDAAAWMAAHAAIPILLTAARGARDSIRVGSGPDAHELDRAGLTAQELCAALVVVAWREVRGDCARHTARAVHDSCETLWRVAGGGGRRWGSNRGGWRVHLETAKAAHAAGRLAIIMDMVAAARTSERLHLKDA